MMNVLIISPCGLPIPAVKGGAVLTLIESLIIQNEGNKNVKFTIVGRYDSEAEKKAKNYKYSDFIFIKPPGILSFLDTIIQKLQYKITKRNVENYQRYLWKMYVIKRVNQLLVNNDYDQVVFQNAGYLLNVLRRSSICKKYSGRLYYHLHNDIPDNIYVPGLKRCKIISVSKYLKIKVEKKCKCNLDNQFYVIKNGFNCRQYKKKLTKDEINRLKVSIGIPISKKVILFAGRIDPSKGIGQLVSAFSQLNRDDAILVICGSTNFGAERISNFESQMKKKFEALGSKILFLGYVPYSEMWKYYKIADVAVLPSMWPEPAGLTMIEATAAGIPLITTDSGGIPEYIDRTYAILLKRDDFLISKLVESINAVLDNELEWKIKASIAQSTVLKNNNEERFYNDFIFLLRTTSNYK